MSEPQADREPPLLVPTTWLAPRLPKRLVVRSRLHDALDHGEHAALTLVVGPAGAGKSVLLSSWLHTVERLQLWVALDEACRDPAVLWRYVLGGLREVLGPDVDDLIDQVDVDRGASDRLLPAIANRLGSVGPLVLVLDDWHVASSGPTDAALEWLIGHLPPTVQLVLSTRANPGFSLHRLRAADALVELRQASLRFTGVEALELFGATSRLRQNDVLRLAEVTEGWAVGLALAAQSVERAADPVAFVRNFDGTESNIADYLVHEVLELLPESTRRFVLATSVLRRLEPELCNHLTGRDDSDRVLRDLVAADLFVIENDEGRGQRRYHHLLRAAFEAQLRQADRKRAEELHAVAARWYEERDDAATAIHHRLAAGDVEEAFRLMRANAVLYLDHGRAAEVSGWVAGLPAGFVANDPSRLADLAVILTQEGDFVRAKELTMRAEAHLGPGPGLVRARIMTHGARSVCEWMIGEPEDSLRYAQLVWDDFDAYGLDDPVVGRLAAAIARVHAWTGDPDRARFQADHSIRFPRAGRMVPLAARPAALSQASLAEGHLREATLHATNTLDALAAMRSPEHPALLDAHLALGGVRCEAGDLDAASEHLDRVVSHVGRSGRTVYGVRARLEMVRVDLARRDVERALRRCDEVRNLLPGRALPRGWDLWVDEVELEVQLAVGRAARAGRLLARLPESVATEVARARCALAAGELDAARQVLAATHARTPREHLGWRLAAAAATSDQADQRRHLDAALDVGEAEGFVQVFLDLPSALSSLLPKLLVDRSATFAPELAQRLTVASGPLDRVASIVEPLTDRELEVLAYLSSSLTSDEIAVRLFVSRNTLKTHLKRIYSKLGATSRRQAVTNAARAGLIRR